MSAYLCTYCKETGELDLDGLCAFCGSEDVRDAECLDGYYIEEGFDGCLDDFDDRGCDDYHRSIEPEFKEE